MVIRRLLPLPFRKVAIADPVVIIGDVPVNNLAKYR